MIGRGSTSQNLGSSQHLVEAHRFLANSKYRKAARHLLQVPAGAPNRRSANDFMKRTAEVDLTSPPAENAGVKKHRHLAVDLTVDEVDLTADPEPSPGSCVAAVVAASGSRGAAGQCRGGTTGPAAGAATAAAPSLLARNLPRGRSFPASLGLRRQQQQQQQQQRRGSPPVDRDADWALAKRLQEEEDRRMAASVGAESSLQRRFRELEAAEAAYEAEEEAGAGQAAGWGRGTRAGWFGGSSGGSTQRGQRGGSSGAAAAAAAEAGGPGQLLHGGAGSYGVLQRTHGRGPRSQRQRRSPAAEANYAHDFAAFLPPFHHLAGGGGGGRGGFGGRAAYGELQQLMMGLQRGLPAHLLFSGRDFTEADYEQLLALDAGNKKKTAPRERVAALETVRVPPAGSSRAAAAAAAAGEQRPSAVAAAIGSPGGCRGSPGPRELGTCAICLEDARPGDRFRVLGCRHAFHVGCIDRWLTQERNSCPICNRAAV